MGRGVAGVRSAGCGIRADAAGGGEQDAQHGEGAATALRGSGLAGRLPVRLPGEVGCAAPPGDCRGGCDGSGGDVSELSVHHVSEPHDAGDGALSGASRDCGEYVLRSEARRDLLLQEVRDELRRELVHGDAAVVAGGGAGDAGCVVLLAGVRGGDCGGAAGRVCPLRRQVRRQQADRPDCGVAEGAGGGAAAPDYALLQQYTDHAGHDFGPDSDRGAGWRCTTWTG